MSVRISKTAIEYCPHLEEMRELALELWGRNVKLAAENDRLRRFESAYSRLNGRPKWVIDDLLARVDMEAAEAKGGELNVQDKT